MRPTYRLLLAALIVSLTASAQTPDKVQEKITVAVVEVPVTVVDRAGNPIRGLTTANFEIVDEGKSRPISSMDTIDFKSQESMNAVSALNPAARRNFMLLFDLSYSSPSSLQRAQIASRDFVAKMVQPRDRVAIATIDAEKGFRLLTAFTTDHKLISDAIGNPLSFRANDPLQLAGTIPWGEVQETGASGSTGGRGGAADATAEYNEMIRRENQVNDQYQRQRAERQIGLLGGLAKALGSINGQKHVILLSEGFDPRVVQGRETGQSVEQQRQNDSIERGEIWNVSSDARFGSITTMTTLDRLGEVAKRSDVVMHAIDIMGVRVDVDASAGATHKSSEGLNMLALATGGTVFKNTNDVGSDFARLVKQQDVVYVLAFSAPTSTPGKYHTLKVKLVNVPGGRATARAGYYEPGKETAVERALTNAEVVMNDIPQNGVRVDALIAPFPTSSTNAQVPVMLEISGPDLIAAAKSGTPRADIMVYAFDEQGFVRDSLVQRMSFDLAKVGGTLKTNGMKFYGTMSLPPGRYAVKTLVASADPAVRGFVRTDVVVPPPTEVALSQPFFYEPAGKWLMVKGASHDKTNAAYPFEVEGTMFIPSASVQLQKGEARTFAVFVQNAMPDELTVQASPNASVVKQVKSGSATKVVMKLDPAAITGSSFTVRVQKKGAPGELTASVLVSVQ